MGYDRLCGVSVAQQKVVLVERLAGLVSDEGGRRGGFESHRIYSNLFYGAISVVACTSCCDRESMSSILI